MDPMTWFSTPGPVPTVAATDLKKVWNLSREIERRHGKNCAIGHDLLRGICSPDADVLAVAYRATQLSLLCEMNILPSRYLQDESQEDRVFEVMASFPMERMQPGVIRQTLPFDVGEFIEQIKAALGGST